MKIRLRLMFFSLFLVGFNLLAIHANAQISPIQQIVSSSDTLLKHYPQEKVHLHFDKPYYTIGDTIWFKAYVVLAVNSKPTELSKIVYVELINEKDSIQQTLRLPLINGTAQGDFILADTLNEGTYRVRSYTRWMQNFDSAWFFDKPIKVGNSLSSDLINTSNYTFTKNGNREEVKAVLKYQTFTGNPASGREISYTVQLGDKTQSRGKGITDASGNLNIQFIQSVGERNGLIRTSVKVDKDRSIVKNIPVYSNTSNVDVQFFPEGGDMVNGISSVMAFKALGADGLGKEITGIITDQDGKRIADIKSQYAGMGTCMFTP